MTSKDTAKIEVDEVNLEDLIILGDEQLINIKVDFPRKDGTVSPVKAKVKQLTIKELRNLDLNNITPDTSVKILEKSLFKEDETPFTKQLILNMPIGVINAITQEILKLSGVNETDMGF